METKKWDFVYDETMCVDSEGFNFAGLISNGDDFLFYRVLKLNEEDKIETCLVYDFLRDWVEGVNEIVRYPWTGENDSILIDALNDSKPIKDIEFEPYKGE